MPSLPGTPITPIACVTRKARNGRVSDRAVAELQDMIAQVHAQNPGMIGQEARVMSEALSRLKRANEFRKLRIPLQIAAIKRVEDRLTDKAYRSAFGGEADEADWRALMSLLVHDPRGKNLGVNVESTWKSILGQVHGRFAAGLERFRTRNLGFKQDKQGLDNFRRELWGEDTGDASAKELARVWKEEVDPYLYRRFRRAGGNLMPRKDWNMPQYHDAGKVMAVKAAVWKDFVRGRLNRADMLDRETGHPIDDAKLERILDEAYESITTAGRSKDHAPRDALLANRHAAERIFVFDSARSAQEYDEKFGSGGDVFSVLTGHMDRMAREIALLEVLGPNPDVTMKQMMRLAGLDRSRKARAGGSKVLHNPIDQSDANRLNNTYLVLTGRDEIPSNTFAANLLSGTKNLLTAAQLGGAVISAVTDFAFQRLAAAFNGMSTGSTAARAMSGFVSGAFGKTETPEFAIRLGLAAEAWAESALGSTRLLGDVLGPKWTRLAAEATLRASGLTGWTQASRHAFGLELLGQIGKDAGKTFDKLNPAFREMLKRRGITAKDWNTIRGSQMESHKGLAYASLLNIEAADPKVGAKLHQVVVEEVEFATPAGSARARGLLKQGTQAGTVWGGVARAAGTYKMFPMLVLMTHGQRLMRDSGGGMGKGQYMAEMFAWMTLLGAVALQAKQITRGNEPIDPFGDKAENFWMAAALQGGALGIYGDFLFADQSRFGASPTETLAGPVFGLGNDLLGLTVGNVQQLALGKETNAWREAVRFADRYTPGSSLWYANLATQRMIFDTAQGWFDPRASVSWRQAQAKQREDFGNDSFWPRGDILP